MNALSELLGGTLKLAIRSYQIVISPLTPASCRYWPSCSEYAVQAISNHGPARGARLAFARLMRCHPWGGWGYDPVPGCADSNSRHHHAPSDSGDRAAAAPVSGSPS